MTSFSFRSFVVYKVKLEKEHLYFSDRETAKKLRKTKQVFGNVVIVEAWRYGNGPIFIINRNKEPEEIKIEDI